MISPLTRRVANTQTRKLVLRSASTLINSSTSSHQLLPSPNNIPSHTSPQQSTSISYQTVRMSSTNPANKNFTREHLFDCKGRVALVTGGGSGIGLMITQALVANGAKVYITGRTTEKLQAVVDKFSEGKDSIIAVPSDITCKDGIKKLVSRVESKESGGLHILVNNAGISGGTVETEAKSADEAKKNLFDTDTATFEDWDSVFRTNVAQLYFTTTAFLPLLTKASEQEHGWSSTVLNITSISGLVKSSQHHFQYNASKAAATHLTRMLANEIAVTNGLRVRINAIAPGVFPSEMTTGESGEDQKSAIPKEKYESKVPAGRPGRDQDMAQAALALVCNQYCNAEVFVVDGGYALALGH
ncbi:hypothetical protein F4808DRAFT_439863 [Astrocystis sublimbata]|nr:hypothetical protein F4808DRAFT_439863 [Astrocystis sublimbata]